MRAGSADGIVRPMLFLNTAVMGLALGQHGLVTRAQLVGLGLSEGVIEGWVRRRQLVRVHRGVYRVISHPQDPEQPALAAVLRCGDGARADGWVSCALHRLEGFFLPESPGVLVPPGRRVAGVGFTVTPTLLLPTDLAVARSVPCLGVGRSLLEVAPHVEPKKVRVAFDSARRKRVLDLPELEELALLHPELPGSPVVLDMLGSGVLLPDGEGARVLQKVLHDLDDLEWEVTDLVPGRRLDCLMRDALLALEYDGRDHHVFPTDRDADGLRELEIRSVEVDGVRLEIFRITAGMLRDDLEGVRRSLRALRAKRVAEVATLRAAARA